MSDPTTLIFNDAFTGTDGTNLTAHTPDTGTGWTMIAGTATLNAANQAKTTGFTFNTYHIQDALGNDQKVEAEWHPDNSNGNGLFLRASGFSGTSFDGYRLLPRPGSNTLRIYRIDAGTATELEVISTAFIAGDKIGFKAVGTRLNAYVNDVRVSADTTDDATYTSGSAGFRCWDPQDPLIDNFSAYDDSGGGGPAVAGGVAAAVHL